MVATLSMAFLVGLSLGLIGGGGSILTVPLFTYVAGMEPRDAIGSALFVVAATSVVALVVHARAGRTLWRTGAWLGGAGMVGAYVAGLASSWVPQRLLMIAFAAIALVTAIAMVRARRDVVDVAVRDLPRAHAVAQGLAIGGLTGLLGVGGGFLIVPALVLVGRVSMERAVATSLLVIAMNSSAGFAAHLTTSVIAWPVVLPVTAVAVCGAILGARLAPWVPATVSRRVFAVLVVAAAIVVLAQELPR